MSKKYLYDLTKTDWQSVCQSMNLASYRLDQILEWLYKKRIQSVADMSNLPAGLRDQLASNYVLCPLEKVKVQNSVDGTNKYLFRLYDKQLIETVLIPASPALYGESSDRRTLCVSSQVGCAFDCQFCASGLAGFTRNLDVGEIVAQVLEVERLSGEKVNNIVFMGMGEPLANFKSLAKAIEIITSEWGIGIGARRITVSTSGVVPKIYELADQPLSIRLAISLHGATNEVRDKIMPINKKYPIEELFEALDYWKTKKKQRITFEYILIKDVNDSVDDAKLLAGLANRVSAKVNLIPYNTVEAFPWHRPDKSSQKQFLQVLQKKNVPSTIRLEKGHDIDAACGQLRLNELKGNF